MSDDIVHFQYDNYLKQYIECTAEHAWEQEGSMELGNAYVPPVKKLLTDTGTRFDHINDLLDYLGDGLLAVTNSLARYANENDALRKKRLENSIVLIEIYRDQLADVDDHKWEFNNMLDKCAPARGVLEEIRKERIEAAKSKQMARPLEETSEDEGLPGA